MKVLQCTVVGSHYVGAVTEVWLPLGWSRAFWPPLGASRRAGPARTLAGRRRAHPIQPPREGRAAGERRCAAGPMSC